MADTTTEKGKEAPRHTEGAERAGNGKYYFEMGSLEEIMGGPAYSTAAGTCIEGDRMMVALMRMPAGSGSEPHSHPNEQWSYIMEGYIDSVIDGVKKRVGPGEVMYIPANTIHNGVATDDGDVVFFTVKDTSWGLHGIKATQ